MPLRCQFSLKAFLVTLTVGCLWLGWRVELARRRERSIDAVAREALVKCRDSAEFLVPGADHFWLDWDCVPVSIIGMREEPPRLNIGKHLSRIRGLASLDLRDWFDADLRLIECLDDGCHVSVSDFTSPMEAERLQRSLPRCLVFVARPDHKL